MPARFSLRFNICFWRATSPRAASPPSHVGGHLCRGESGWLHTEIGAQGSEAEALAGLLAVPQPEQPGGALAAAPAQRYPSVVLTYPPPAPPAHPSPPATGAGALGRPEPPLVTPLCLPVLARPLPTHPLPFSRLLLRSRCFPGRDPAGVILLLFCSCKQVSYRSVLVHCPED